VQQQEAHPTQECERVHGGVHSRISSLHIAASKIARIPSWLEEAVSEKKEKKKQDDFALAC